jgi:hypothetical protein
MVIAVPGIVAVGSGGGFVLAAVLAIVLHLVAATAFLHLRLRSEGGTRDSDGGKRERSEQDFHNSSFVEVVSVSHRN